MFAMSISPFKVHPTGGDFRGVSRNWSEFCNSVIATLVVVGGAEMKCALCGKVITVCACITTCTLYYSICVHGVRNIGW